MDSASRGSACVRIADASGQQSVDVKPMRTSAARRITSLDALDIRFPTSVALDGSDAMNPDPDYSAAYVILRTDHDDGLEGHGLTFTIGRGNELCVAAAMALAPLVVGLAFEEITADMGAFWRRIVGDSQLRWVGPEKGVLHLATAAVVNAVWDLWAKIEQKPLWKLLVDMSPEELVRCIDFRYITDAITPADAVALLEPNVATRHQREAELQRSGYPAYTTSAGWLGYSDDKIRRLCREGLADGWSHFKIKVGRDLSDDVRRAAIIREEIGPHRKLMMDANQVWDVGQAITSMKELARFDPWWIEEPTSPDDVLGHATIARAIAPIGVATGEQCQNRIVFKQLMQAGAIRFCQIDSCRLGGVNEVLAVILLAARFGIPVCPHAGGVGLCEYVQHLAIFDYVCVSASLEDRIVEYVDQLHEHFLHPVVIRDGRYMPPTAPGYSITMRPESLYTYSYPDGPAWARRRTPDVADATGAVS
jgi:L-fuconate dehydratase